ncbi:hypothetical protein ID866_6740 [Astraeus odoratus]|nr:hypothetical protein ID866_6740 [Astraeus odoratus]
MATTSVRTFPQASSPLGHNAPRRIRTEPGKGGFMNVVMKKHSRNAEDEGIGIPDDDDDDDANIKILTGEKKMTQEQQDKLDEKARKRAMKNLVNSWQERLQLISVITTFFASVEAGMLVNTKPLTTDDQENNILKASNASLLGALIMHVYAAVLSFLAAFLLIRYKLHEASREELIAEGIKLASSPLAGSVRSRDLENNVGTTELRHAFSIAEETPTQTPVHGRQPIMPLPPRSASQLTNDHNAIPRMASLHVEPPILSRNPHLEQVGLLWFRDISSHLLDKIHTLCILFAALGFVLALAGIVLYAWAIQPRAVSVFATACLGGAFLAMVYLII